MLESEEMPQNNKKKCWKVKNAESKEMLENNKKCWKVKNAYK